MKNKVANNQDKIANEINKLGLEGVDAVGDDGSVCISVKGSVSWVREVAQVIHEKWGNISIGDGVQAGVLWINSDENNIHEEVLDII